VIEKESVRVREKRWSDRKRECMCKREETEGKAERVYVSVRERRRSKRQKTGPYKQRGNRIC
jgi:hypothetical protein